MTSLEDRRRGVLAAVERTATVAERRDVLQRVAELLGEGFEWYGWVGIFLVRGQELVLEAWKGAEPSERQRVPIASGPSGIVALSQKTLVIDDTTEGGYEAPPFGWTRSEIVVPMTARGMLVGELVIESRETAAFDAADCAFLERVADIVAGSV